MDCNARFMNGIDGDALRRIATDVEQDPALGLARFAAATTWKGGTRSDTRIDAWHLGGRRLPKDFTLRADEPAELLGSNTAPNPQEMLLAALNACMTVGYVAGCALAGIEIVALSIRTEGELDLRGFLGLDPDVPPGYTTLRTTVRLQARGTHDQLRAIHESVLRTSPNRFNLSQPIRHEAELILD